VTGENLTEAGQIADRWKGYCEELYHDDERKGIQPSVRQHVANPQVLMRSQQNCSKQEEKQYWTECTEYVVICRTGEWPEEWTFSTFIPLS